MNSKRLKKSDEEDNFATDDLSSFAADIMKHLTEESQKTQRMIAENFEQMKAQIGELGKQQSDLREDLEKCCKEINDSTKIVRFIREELAVHKRIGEIHGKTLDELIAKIPCNDTETETISTSNKLVNIDKAVLDIVEQMKKLACQIADVVYFFICAISSIC